MFLFYFFTVQWYIWLQFVKAILLAIFHMQTKAEWTLLYLHSEINSLSNKYSDVNDISDGSLNPTCSLMRVSSRFRQAWQNVWPQ